MKKIIYMLIIASISLYFYQSNQGAEPTSLIDSIPAKNDSNKINTAINQTSKEVVNEISPFTEMLTMDLFDRWEDEYGCFDVNSAEPCSKYSFLSARSLKEAEWMRRQGFPSKSLIEMAKDPLNELAFNELLNKKSPAAHTVATLLALEGNDNEKASTMALRNKYFSQNSKSYPYRLYGEVLLAQGERVSAISQFQMAALLGDAQSNSIVHGIAAGDVIFASHAMNRAYEMLNDMFDVIPKDPRPEGFGGG